MEFSKEWMRSPKERGEWAEMRFLARAAEEGFRVSKPWGDSARYDFAVEREGRFLRIQVKSTVSRLKNGYRCWLQPSNGTENPRKLYTAEQVDFFAAYVIPEDVWYILPAEVAVQMRGWAWLFPGSPGHKYERYKEAWELLRAAVSGKEAPVVEEDGPAGVEVDASGVPGESLEIRAVVEAAGFDRDRVRGRMAECFERMRR
jgi:PD-(D/E)XK endonuclease